MKRDVFPSETLLPLVAVSQLTQYSDKVKFDSEFVEFDINFEKMNLMTPKQKKALRSIKGGEFSKEKNSKGNDALA